MLWLTRINIKQINNGIWNQVTMLRKEAEFREAEKEVLKEMKMKNGIWNQAIIPKKEDGRRGNN